MQGLEHEQQGEAQEVAIRLQAVEAQEAARLKAEAARMRAEMAAMQSKHSLHIAEVCAAQGRRRDTGSG